MFLFLKMQLKGGQDRPGLQRNAKTRQRDKRAKI